MPLVIYGLEGGHTHIHTYPHKSDFKNHGRLAPGLKSKETSQTT